VAALEKKNGLARAFKRAVPAAALKACCEQIRAVLTARESSPEAAPGTV
jgi:DNA/RNA-binding protein